VAAGAGGIDIALNAVGIVHVQGTPFAELSFQDYAHPITAYTRTNFLTAKAVARHMVKCLDYAKIHQKDKACHQNCENRGRPGPSRPEKEAERGKIEFS
jgi:NAD(P)-dependent dehydrogenase (short-subunit alcohol dehydrogenase family)